jgi:hypothetical protein
MKCPSCNQTLKQSAGVCGEYSCQNPKCPQKTQPNLQAQTEFYGLTQTELNKNYQTALAKKQPKETEKTKNKK